MRRRSAICAGGMLGMGEKFFAIPWHALKLENGDKQFMLDTDKDRLKNAPGFDKKHWPDMANEQLRRDRKGALEEGMEGAGRTDCLHAPATQPNAGGLLQLPSVVGRAMSGNCPK